MVEAFVVTCLDVLHGRIMGPPTLGPQNFPEHLLQHTADSRQPVFFFFFTFVCVEARGVWVAGDGCFFRGVNVFVFCVW